MHCIWDVLHLMSFTNILKNDKVIDNTMSFSEGGEMKVKHICFFSEGYPTEDYPFFTFVRQLVVAIADKGVKCTVIAPQSVTKNLIRNTNVRPERWIDITKNGSEIIVLQPKYISFSTLNLFGTNVSHYFFEKAAIAAYQESGVDADVLYGHFWHSGMVAAKIAKIFKVPVIVASGEAMILVDDFYRRKIIDELLPYIRGTICVSAKNFDESLEHGLIEADKMIVIPNAIDSNLFFLSDKLKARQKLGISDDKFIVAFTGSFIHRKGSKRVQYALEALDDVYGIFIGSGDEEPDGERVIFSGTVPHEEVVEYLNASDVFVLPTLAEGCCNAIIEAEACGLPIISSDKRFNDDILTEQNSIRINSLDVEAIANAITFVKDHPDVAESMKDESLRISNQLQIEKRADKVIEFINSCVR